MTREAYEAARRRARDAIDPREDRGLPHHPSPSGWLTCPECEGGGEIVHNNTGDPQDDYGVMCERCTGAGTLVEGRGQDPLVLLREARMLRRLNPTYLWNYEHARRVAMRPCSRLAQAEMLAMAQRCVNRVDRWAA